MTKQDFILSLVKAGLWQEKMEHFDMTPYEYGAVIEEADKQCVMGLVMDCLKQNNMGLKKKCVIHMMKTINALEVENRRLDENVIALNNILKDNDISFVVVKGQVVASLYPKPHMRIPGDVDFYVPKSDFKKAVDVLNDAWGLELDGDLPKMHLGFKYNGDEFEMHRYLKYFPNAKRLKMFNDVIDKYPFDYIALNGTEVSTLNPTLNVFYTFVHLYGHFIKLGVALRQVCDLAILMHHFKNEIDRDLLRELLKQFGFTRAFKAIGSIMVDKLGLPEDDFPWDIKSKDKKIGLKALQLIWKHGNWGKYERSYDTGNKNYKYYLEKTFYRLNNHILFFQLSPKENISMLFTELPKKTLSRLKKS